MASLRENDMVKILKSLKNTKDNKNTHSSKSTKKISIFNLSNSSSVSSISKGACSSSSTESVEAKYSSYFQSKNKENQKNIDRKKQKESYSKTKPQSSIQNLIQSYPFMLNQERKCDESSSKKSTKNKNREPETFCPFKSNSSQASNIKFEKCNDNIKIKSKDTPDNKNLNNNSNDKYKKCYMYDDDKESVRINAEFDICSTDAVRKKFKRVNKIFYNGFLNKPDKRSDGQPEYEAHAAELLHFLKSLWVTNTMCDLCIVIDNKKYPAHRVSLAMFSKKYRHEFQKQLQNKNSGIYTICLKHTTAFALEAILKYIYTSKIDINPANVEEILHGAKELGVDDLICMASDYLSSLSIGDVLDYMGNMLNKEGAELMVYELYVYIMTHLDKISRTPEYLKSSICVVSTLLSDSHLSVKKELEVFDAAMRWIEYDKYNRVKYLDDAMSNVRFTLISPDELVSKVENQLCLMKNPEIYKMLYNSFKYHALNNTSCKLTSITRKEEGRNVCLKGASVPDDFVKAIKELSEIAHRLKVDRKYTSYDIVDECNSS